MSRKRTCTAIVLRAIDIAEADRFCIVLTREHGRLAVRARGARRAQSVMPALLPGRVLRMELRESGSAFLLTAAYPAQDAPSLEQHVQAFLRFQHAAEALLALLHDDEPLPTIFDDALRYVRLCAAGAHDPFPIYALRLLASLGLLPTTTDDLRYASLPAAVRGTVLTAAGTAWCSAAAAACPREARMLAEALLREHATHALRVADIARQFSDVEEVSLPSAVAR